MRVFVSYPPLPSPKGTAQVGQNRQFQWFKQASVIYPMVPAYAATLLRAKGYDVFWDDAIAKKETQRQWIERIRKERPGLVAIETKTPVVERHWKAVDIIKRVSPDTKTVLMGDHVTGNPLESFLNSHVDYVVTGGDYDFLLLSVAEHVSAGKKLEPGIYFRTPEGVKDTGLFRTDYDLVTLPFIDRDLTHWWLYKENGNYKHLPGTYTMVGRDCWWGKCTFCSWPALYPRFRTRSPESLVNELSMLSSAYGIKEVMDDTGTFPVGGWLKEFCRLMIESGLNKRIRISCNMRFGVLKPADYRLMRKAGFRFLLFGLESANQSTLDRINKGITVKDIVDGVRWAKKAGINPHLTVMIGYPWEDFRMASRTIGLAKMLFENGWADTLQATIVMPYPNTSLYMDCMMNSQLEVKHGEWERFDMRSKVMKSPLTEEQIKALTSSLYRLFFSPKYIYRQAVSVRSWNDVMYMVRGVYKVIGKHLRDFG